MNRAVSLLFASLLVACSSVPPPAEPEALGEIVAIEGFPAAQRDGSRYIVAEQSRIYAGDILTTNTESRLELQLSDGSRVAIGPGTQVLVQAFREARVLQLNLTRGALFIDLAEDLRLRLRSSIANVSLNSGRGIAIIRRNILDAAVIEGGPMVVANDDGQVTLAGVLQGTTAIGGSAPQAPFAWTGRRLDRETSEIRVLTNLSP